MSKIFIKKILINIIYSFQNILYLSFLTDDRLVMLNMLGQKLESISLFFYYDPFSQFQEFPPSISIVCQYNHDIITPILKLLIFVTHN